MLQALHMMSVLIFPLALLVLLWHVWIVWTTRNGWRAWFAKAWSIVLAFSSLLLVWVGLAFHLIGFGLKY